MLDIDFNNLGLIYYNNLSFKKYNSNYYTWNYNNLLYVSNIDNWEDIFKVILEENAKIKKVIVIDEFQYLGKINQAFPSIFQKIWDEILKENIINKQSYLYEEPLFLLQNEVSEVGSYFSIIKSIAAGNRKLGNIASNLSVSPTNLSKYLQTLINLDIIEREVPITETNQGKSKKGQYKIKDNFISFWFQFIYPNKSLIEMGQETAVLNKIKFY